MSMDSAAAVIASSLHACGWYVGPLALHSSVQLLPPSARKYSGRVHLVAGSVRG